MSAMPCTQPIVDLKESVREFWEREPCGSRYLGSALDFHVHTRTRYELEPHIPGFAGFSEAGGLRVLEIGVGMGADYLEWLKAGAVATGVDLSPASLEKARQRCEIAGYQPDLRLADAEHLPFPDSSFDLVYSYGVMHHSPDTQACLREAWRVLRPGGQARIMLYHHPSWTGLMLWLRFGWWRAMSVRTTVFNHLESQGTKSYTVGEVRSMMSAFENICVTQVFSPGDLLAHQPSARFRAGIYKLGWRFYPRFLVRRFGRCCGLFLLIKASKPRA